MKTNYLFPIFFLILMLALSGCAQEDIAGEAFKREVLVVPVDSGKDASDITSVRGDLVNEEEITLIGSGFGLHEDYNEEKDHLNVAWKDFADGQLVVSNDPVENDWYWNFEELIKLERFV